MKTDDQTREEEQLQLISAMCGTLSGAVVKGIIDEFRITRDGDKFRVSSTHKGDEAEQECTSLTELLLALGSFQCVLVIAGGKGEALVEKTRAMLGNKIADGLEEIRRDFEAEDGADG